MTDRQQLTDKQRLTLDFIQHYIARHTVPPKLQEIAEGIGINSRGVAHRYVQALADTGFIETDSGKHRGIRLLGPNPHHDESILPLLGKIAAGKPIEAIPSFPNNWGQSNINPNLAINDTLFCNFQIIAHLILL